MAFTPVKKLPEFADLKITLAKSQETESALYQTVETLIDRLDQYRASQAGLFISTPSTGVGGGMNLDYLGNYVAGPVYNDGDIVVAADNIAYMCVVDGTTTPPEPWPGIGIATAVGPPGPQGPPGPTGPQGPAGTGAVVDATYWTAQPHSGLANERALSLLSNGYVKSTSGEPSTVAIIPLSEGGTGSSLTLGAYGTVLMNGGGGVVSFASGTNITNLNASALTQGTVPVGALPPGIAWLANQQIFTAFNIFDGAVDQILIRGLSASLLFRSNAAPAANRDIRLYCNTVGDFQIVTLNSTGTVQTSIFYLTASNGVVTANGYGINSIQGENIWYGIVGAARLGSGTANSSTVLYGDNVWRVPPAAAAFPAGLIALSLTPCPIGWTRVNIDGYFLRSGPTPGATGGAATHTHPPGSYKVSIPGQNVGFSASGNANDPGGQQFGYGGTISGTTGGGSGGINTADAGGSFQTNVTGHVHGFSANYSGLTDPSPARSLPVNTSGTVAIPGQEPAVFGVSSEASSLPPHYDIYLCQKD